MRTIFVDAGFWVALLHTGDDLHIRASTRFVELQGSHFVTTQMVLTESVNHVSRLGPHLRSEMVNLMQELEQRDDVEIIEQTGPQYQAALERYADRLDQDWSLTDCASFLTMEARGIQEALAYDSDFVQAGFIALLRD